LPFEKNSSSDYFSTQPFSKLHSLSFCEFPFSLLFPDLPEYFSGLRFGFQAHHFLRMN